MSTAAMVTMLIGAAIALLLNWRNLRSQAQPASKLVTSALIWATIIAVLALFISQYRD